VQVNESFETNIPRIFAAGEPTGFLTLLCDCAGARQRSLPQPARLKVAGAAREVSIAQPVAL
jgi:hypothetical protein